MSKTLNQMEYFDNLTGQISQTKTCPICGSRIWVNGNGDEWCGGDWLECQWANSEELRRGIISLLDIHKPMGKETQI